VLTLPTNLPTNDTLPSPRLHLPVVSVSEMRTYRRCPREHHYAYDELRRPVLSAETLRFGTLIHYGLEAWWREHMRAGDAGASLVAALRAMSERTSDPWDLARSQVMITGYHARWADVPYLVLAVEAEFRTPLINPATGRASQTRQLGGKLDVLVRDQDSRALIIEHKTSSEDLGPGSEYWRRLRMDPQISTYFVGARALGIEPDACLYDVLGKPALRPSQVPVLDLDGVKIVLDSTGTRVRTKDGKKWRESASSADGYVLQTREETVEEFRQRLCAHVSENPDRYFQRGEVVRLESDELDAAADAWATVRAMAEGKAAGRFPRNPDACIRYGRTCAYFDVCTGVASLSDPTRFRTAESAHEELSE